MCRVQWVAPIVGWPGEGAVNLGLLPAVKGDNPVLKRLLEELNRVHLEVQLGLAIGDGVSGRIGARVM